MSRSLSKRCPCLLNLAKSIHLLL